MLWSTALMWLVAELFESLPEAGDLPKPKLVFFLDEAHLLFADATKAFLESVARTVRLIRSKGVGVFFVTQQPTDVPDEVLGQLGMRVQHALRAFTPERRQGPARDRLDLSALGLLRPRDASDLDGHGRGGGDAAVRVRRADAGGPHAPRRAPPRGWPRPTTSRGREGVAAVGPLRRADRPAERARDPRGAPGPGRGDRPRALRRGRGRAQVRAAARAHPGARVDARTPAPPDPEPRARAEGVLARRDRRLPQLTLRPGAAEGDRPRRLRNAAKAL